MQNQKPSISVPPQLVAFLEEYKRQHHLVSCSEVISMAIQLLQKHELRAHYQEAYGELDQSDADLEIFAGDGLVDETW